ncbi:MAG: alpha/beta hydrolase fold domain-containing protein [Bacteroidetes bacterium]|nr:alpha/beta hydrolase fold domain-containing protein [Bacteroidota bacterium]
MKLYFNIMLSFVLMGVSFWSNAQCNRFVEEIFDEVNVETVYFSDSTDFQMDIYTPAQDETDLPRPLIILAHGGSFVGGTKNNSTMTTLCTRFAKKGYVCASIDYSLAAFALQLLDSTIMMDVVVRAVNDGKAAIRFFRKDAATDNLYNIDPEQIYFGGNSAGAILACHLAYLDMEELPDSSFLYEIVALHGGSEGNGGNTGYDSHINGVINLAGGLNMASFLDANETETLFSCHGDQDGVVPYDCNDVYFGDPTFGQYDLVDVCGSHVLHAVADEIGLMNTFVPFPGDGHTPWDSNSSKMEIVVDSMTVFLRQNLGEEYVQSFDDTEVAIVGLPDMVYIENTPLTLVGEPSGGVFSGNWFVGNEFSPEECCGVEMITYTYTQNGCEYSISQSVQLVTLSGIDHLNAVAVTAFPNPADNEIYFSGLSENIPTTFVVYNYVGQVVMQQTAFADAPLSVAHLPQGNYFVLIRQNDTFAKASFQK